MKNSLNTVELAWRHWRFLVLTWLLPFVAMLLVVAHDITGDQRFLSRGLLIVVVPVILSATGAAAHLQRREHLPWGVFYIIWLVPMMAAWCALILVRAAILIPLGHPL